jgi:hypothetical protein
MVLGMIPQVRYVVFTDRLLESLEPDELDAVLGHEVGHVRHHHIPYYVSFFLLSSLVATATAMTVEKYIKLPEFEISSVNSEWMILPPIAGMVAYLFTVFGFLSRRCERQADIFGGRAGSCHNPSCTGHDADTVLSPQGQSVCPTGVRHLIHALERVCELNGSGSIRHQTRHPLQRLAAMIRSWQHGPIRDRVDFLHQIAADPTLAERTERRINRFRFVLMSILIAILMLMGMASGWRDIWKWM